MDVVTRHLLADVALGSPYALLGREVWGSSRLCGTTRTPPLMCLCGSTSGHVPVVAFGEQGLSAAAEPSIGFIRAHCFRTSDCACRNQRPRTNTARKHCAYTDEDSRPARGVINSIRYTTKTIYTVLEQTVPPALYYWHRP